jgi:hypothetical protein
MTTAQERADLMSKIGLDAQNKASIGPAAGMREHWAGHGEVGWSDGGDNPYQPG